MSELYNKLFNHGASAYSHSPAAEAYGVGRVALALAESLQRRHKAHRVCFFLIFNAL